MLCHAVSLRVHAMAWCSAVAKLVTRLIVLRAALMNVVCSCIRGSSAAAAAAAAAGHSRLGRKPGPLPMPGGHRAPGGDDAVCRGELAVGEAAGVVAGASGASRRVDTPIRQLRLRTGAAAPPQPWNPNA